MEKSYDQPIFFAALVMVTLFDSFRFRRWFRFFTVGLVAKSSFRHRRVFISTLKSQIPDPVAARFG